MSHGAPNCPNCGNAWLTGESEDHDCHRTLAQHLAIKPPNYKAMSERETPETDSLIDSHCGVTVTRALGEMTVLAIKLERERDEAREERTWRSIESAPTDGTDILTFPHYHITHYNDDRDQIDSPGWVDHWEERIEKFVRMRTPPTHWMPLPKPPTGGPER